MIRDYEQLHQAVKDAISTFFDAQAIELAFSIADNGSCSVLHPTTQKKFTFMLAKFGDEIKVGFAFFEAGEAQPDWIDDLPAQSLTQEQIVQLFENELA